MIEKTDAKIGLKEEISAVGATEIRLLAGLASFLVLGALTAGLIGALIIVRPGSELFTPYALLPLGMALCNALYQILTRKIAGLGGYGLQVEDRIPLVMDPGAHNADYLQTKRTKLGHLMGEGPSCPIGGPAVVLAWHGQASEQELVDRRQSLQAWALEQGLRLEAEPEVRLLALLNSPQLTVMLSAGPAEDCSSQAVVQAIGLLARWTGTQRLSLMLAPGLEHSSHPSADLEPEQRPLAELHGSGDAGGPAALAGLRLDQGSFLVWR
jgi:3,4-dihydroxy 2-butanone 4-phosphate synthase/GTP cyclohydrolase II